MNCLKFKTAFVKETLEGNERTKIAALFYLPREGNAGDVWDCLIKLPHFLFNTHEGNIFIAKDFWVIIKKYDYRSSDDVGERSTVTRNKLVQFLHVHRRNVRVMDGQLAWGKRIKPKKYVRHRMKNLTEWWRQQKVRYI